MGIFEKLKAEFIDIVEWVDSTNDTMVYRFERYQNEIKNGAQLTVRESQVAVFVNEGQIADVFQPGMYRLETKNLPILATLKGWKYGFNSPFKAEVYFANTRNFTNLKWGTKNPIILGDPKLGQIRMRAFGTYAIRIKDPVKVIREIAGTDARFTIEEISEQLRNIIITRLSDTTAESKISYVNLASQYDELSKVIQDKIKPEFDEYGLELTKFLIENISLPQEQEEAIDAKNSMDILGVGSFGQYQAAKSMKIAANNPGGTMGEGLGMGMGFAMASQMGGMFQPGQFQQAQAPQAAFAPPPIPGSAQYYAVINGQQAGPYPDSALRQLIQQQMIKTDTLVWKQGMAAWAKAGEVPDVAPLFAPMGPPPIPPV